MKKALMIVLLCVGLLLSVCAAAESNDPAPFSTGAPQSSPGPVLPAEITDGASTVYCSWLDEARGFLLRCGYPAIGQMPKALYRTLDGQNWEPVRELSAVIPNYPKGLFFWSESRGVILTNYHGAENCVFVTQDGGDTWEAVPFDLHSEFPVYNYLEAERAWLESGSVMVELSVHFEDGDPQRITRPLPIAEPVSP